MKKLTKEQAAIIGAYTGFLVGKVDGLYEYVEKIMERPVLTHEMASKEFWAEIKEKSKPDLMKIVNDD